MPAPRVHFATSLVCLDCREDGIALAEAGQLEDWWEDHPVEVSERTCLRCGKSWHWWFFLRSTPRP